MPPPVRGRPTEQPTPASAMTRLRLTPGELEALRAVAKAQGVSVSRLLQRAVISS